VSQNIEGCLKELQELRARAGVWRMAATQAEEAHQAADVKASALEYTSSALEKYLRCLHRLDPNDKDLLEFFKAEAGVGLEKLEDANGVPL